MQMPILRRITPIQLDPIIKPRIDNINYSMNLLKRNNPISTTILETHQMRTLTQRTEEEERVMEETNELSS